MVGITFFFVSNAINIIWRPISCLVIFGHYFMPYSMLNTTLLDMLLPNPKMMLYDFAYDSITESIIDSIIDANRDAKIDAISTIYETQKGIYKRHYYEYIEDTIKTL